MKLVSRSKKAAALGAALLISVPLVLSGCGSSSSASPSSAAPASAAAAGASGAAGSAPAAGPAATVHVLDYYNEGNDNKVIGATLTACGKANNLNVVRDAVPGGGLIQKVLQQASSKTLPDVLMLDNPDLQQIAASGALTPLSDYGISADGYAPRASCRPAPTRASSTGSRPPSTRSRSSTTRTCWPRPASPRRPPGTSCKTDAKKLTTGSQYGFASRRQRHLRGHLAVPAVHVVQRRRREEHRHSARPPRRCSSGSTW